jgi:hypothetical protein
VSALLLAASPSTAATPTSRSAQHSPLTCSPPQSNSTRRQHAVPSSSPRSTPRREPRSASAQAASRRRAFCTDGNAPFARASGRPRKVNARRLGGERDLLTGRRIRARCARSSERDREFLPCTPGRARRGSTLAAASRRREANLFAIEHLDVKVPPTDAPEARLGLLLSNQAASSDNNDGGDDRRVRLEHHSPSHWTS